MSFNNEVLHNEYMNPIYQVQQIINRYIALPLAIKIFKKDQAEFQKFKIGNLYLDLLDNLIEQINNDYLELKREMYSKYHLDVKYLGKENNKERYKINNEETVEYTPAELKELVRSIMEEYLYNERTRTFERKERIYSKD